MPGDPSFASARSICLTIAMKAARIGGMLGAYDEGDPVSEEMWNLDAVPNLILLELLRVRFDRVVAEIRERHPHAEAWPRVARARADLDRVLAVKERVDPDNVLRSNRNVRRPLRTAVPA